MTYLEQVLMNVQSFFISDLTVNYTFWLIITLIIIAIIKNRGKKK